MRGAAGGLGAVVIAHVGQPVRIGRAQSVGAGDIGGGAVGIGGVVAVLPVGQRVGQRGAGGQAGHGEDSAIAERDRQRVGPRGAVVAQIVHRQEAALVRHVTHKRRSDVATIESFFALAGKLFQCLGHLALVQPLIGQRGPAGPFGPLAIVQIQRRCVRVTGQITRAGGDDKGRVPIHVQAAFGQIHGRGQQRVPRHPAKAAVRGGNAGHRAGHSHRCGTGDIAVLDHGFPREQV